MRARGLLHRDKEERYRHPRHRDDAGSDRPEQVARCLRVGKDVALQQLPRRFQPGKTRPVEKVRTDGEEEKSDVIPVGILRNSENARRTALNPLESRWSAAACLLGSSWLAVMTWKIAQKMDARKLACAKLPPC